MSKEHPILFSADMVKAILDGRKTQTRRLMKPQPSTWDKDEGSIKWNDQWYEWVEEPEIGAIGTIEQQAKYQPGDRLKVREVKPRGLQEGLITASITDTKYVSEDAGITLEVTAVRCEQIRELCFRADDEIKAEGVEAGYLSNALGFVDYDEVDENRPIHYRADPNGYYRAGFANLWRNLYPGSWERNDWVWVYEFKVIT